jgi:hypothetical protein
VGPYPHGPAHKRGRGFTVRLTPAGRDLHSLELRRSSYALHYRRVEGGLQAVALQMFGAVTLGTRAGLVTLTASEYVHVNKLGREKMPS